MMPSSRRMCSRTCRYCSRRCSRRASTAESLRRDATPLLANLQRAKKGAGAGQSEALAAWPAAAERWRDDRMRRAEETKRSSVFLQLRLAQAKRCLRGCLVRLSSDMRAKQPASHRDGGLRWCRSLLREELQRAVGGGDLTHGVAAPLGEPGRRRGLVVDVDAAVRTLDRRRAGR